MEKLWWFSESGHMFKVPGSEAMVDSEGSPQAGLMDYCVSPASPGEFASVCAGVDQLVLVFSRKSFDPAYLAAIPQDIPRLALIKSNTSVDARLQLEQLELDGLVFSPFTQDSIITSMKKSYDDRQSLSALQDELKNYSSIAFTAMSSASEMGQVAFYAQAVQNISSLERLAQQTLRSLSDLSVNGIVQFCFDETQDIYPKVVAPGYRRLLDQMRGSAHRIISQGRFLIFNFENAQILVTDAPVADGEKYGRLRDVIAHIASIAEARAKTIKANIMLKEQQENTRMVLMLLEMASKDNRQSVKKIMTELSLSLRELATGMDLTLQQETSLLQLSDHALTSLERLHEATDAIEDHFRSLVIQLDMAAKLLHTEESAEAPVADQSVELF
jgi:hypothetical protein